MIEFGFSYILFLLTFKFFGLAFSLSGNLSQFQGSCNLIKSFNLGYNLFFVFGRFRVFVLISIFMLIVLWLKLV